MNKAMKVIDFCTIQGPVYTGRERGQQLRAEYHLDEIDGTNGQVDVQIPSTTYTISSSFFLGMFGPSVVKAGSKDEFYRRYHFQSPQFLKEVMDGYVVRALQNRTLFP